MEKLKKSLKLFLLMFKIGLFTFGGGYAMIAIIEREIVEKRNLIEHDEFLDMIAIAESTPGPIAINSATYIGYKSAGVLGSFFATLGVVLPSFIIIFVISLFYEAFMSLTYVSYAFLGIQACIPFIILSAGIRMLKKLQKSLFNYLLCFLTIGCLVAFSVFSIAFSSIYYILIGGAVGVVLYLVLLLKNKNLVQPVKEEASSENTEENSEPKNVEEEGVEK